jgi:hypothetical protein
VWSGEGEAGNGDVCSTDLLSAVSGVKASSFMVCFLYKC